jgi:hypothetical protein
MRASRRRFGGRANNELRGTRSRNVRLAGRQRAGHIEKDLIDPFQGSSSRAFGTGVHED